MPRFKNGKETSDKLNSNLGFNLLELKKQNKFFGIYYDEN